MTTTPTERRLAITPGEWKVRGRYDVYAAVGTYVGTTRANNPEEMPENFRAIDEANAELIAEAGTTYNACGLTPSELLAKVREAQAALISIGEYWNRDQNETAMADACWHALNLSAETLEKLNLPR